MILARNLSAIQESKEAVAVLVSGGIDSAVLAVEMARRFHRVHPIYVRFGLRWEEAELEGLRCFLQRINIRSLRPLVILDESIKEVYEDHWSVGGPPVPGSDSPDEAVYLPGRNLLLITKASVWCQIRSVGSLALGTLASNPFPDSTPEFFREFESVLNRGMDASIRLIRPFERLTKAEVMKCGEGLPLELTFSCLDPIGHRHCGSCNKCEERRRAFLSVGILDPTQYARASTGAN